MEYVKDILLDDGFDLQIRNGDFVVGESDEQHLTLISLLEPGQLRYSPLTGLGMFRKLQSPISVNQQDQIRRDLYEQLEYDGYISGTASIDFKEEFEIKAER